MGNIMDCGNSETRKGDGDKNNSIKSLSELQPKDSQDHRIPVDILDVRKKNKWKWVKGYKIRQIDSKAEWQVELESGDEIVVPLLYIHEPCLDYAHTSYIDINPAVKALFQDITQPDIAPPSSPLHFYIDVLDIYRDTQNRVVQKWRKAEIIQHNRYCTIIKVHYLNWAKRYDEKINLIQDFDTRIKPFGSMTDSMNNTNDNVPSGSINPEHRFRKQLDSNIRGRMRVYLCKGDGNCLFRAVAHQIWQNQERHEEMRKLCCDYAEEHNIGREMYAENDHEGYVNYMNHRRRLGVWGDDPEIRSMESMLDARIEVWNASLEDGGGLEPSTIHLSGSLPPSAESPTAITIRISLHGNNHYNSVILGKSLPLISDFPNNTKCKLQTIYKWRNEKNIEDEKEKDQEGKENDEEDLEFNIDTESEVVL